MSLIPDSWVEKIADSLFDFASDKAKDIAGDGTSDWIAGLRDKKASKAKIRKAINSALEEFQKELPTDETGKALSLNLITFDRTKIEEAVTKLTEDPTAREPVEALRRVFKLALTQNESADSNTATSRFLDLLAQKLFAVEELQGTFSLLFQYRSDKTLQNIAGTLERIEEHVAPNPSDLNVPRRKYLEYLVNENQNIDLRGIRQAARAVTLPLDEVYVSLTAERRVSFSVAVDADAFPVAERDEGFVDANEAGHISLRGHGRLRVETRSEHVEFAPSVRDNRRMVILGDPGAGKTTLLGFLTLHFAREFKDRNFHGVVTDKQGNTYGPARLPIPLRVSVFAQEFAKDNGLSLREFLPTAFGNAGVPEADLKRLFEDAYTTGDALILLDGLDEIVNSGDRARIVREVESFVNGLGIENRVIITSRIAGYQQAGFNEAAFIHLTLQKLERPQIEQFLTRWCRAVERFHDQEAPKDAVERRAQREIDGILKAVDENPGVARLAENPLMLKILTVIHRNGRRLPSRRVELYRIAAETLLEDWRLPFVGERNIVTVREADDVLAPLAYWMHETKPTGTATQEEVEDKLTELLGKIRHRDGKSESEAISDFLRRIREQVGILVERGQDERGQGIYGFLHLTFEEYFTAREIVQRTRTAAGKIYPHRHDPRWLEPILLAVGSRSASDAADLIQTAILAEGEDAEEKGFKPSLHEDILHRDLLLAVRCIGDCDGVDSEVRRPVVEKLLNIYFDVRGSGKYELLRERISKAFESLSGCDACADAIPIVLGKLRAAEWQVRASAAEALGRLGERSETVVTGLVAALWDTDGNVRASAAEALGRLDAGSEAVVTGLAATLRDADWRVRASAAEALGRLGAGSETVVTGLVAVLWDTDGNVRASAAEALVRLGAGTPGVVTELVKALRDPDWRVQARAVEALGRLGAGSEAVVTELMKALQDADGDVRKRAAEALGRLGAGSEAVAMGLVEAVRDADNDVRKRATEALGLLGAGTPEVVTGLVEAVRDGNWQMRASAAEALGLLGVGTLEVVTGLVAALRDADSDVRARVVEAVGRLGAGSEAVVTGLVAALRDGNWQVQVSAAEAVGRLGAGSEAVVTGLVEALRDDDWRVRARAAEVLGRLGAGTPEVVTGLLAAFRDASISVRASAAEALGRIGVGSEAVVTGLVAALRDANWNVRARAALALGQLIGTKKRVGRRKAETIAEEIHKMLTTFQDARFSQTVNEKYYGNAFDALWDALWMVCQAIDERAAQA